MLIIAAWLKQNFLLFQILFGGGALLFAWLFLRPKEPESNFKLREADRPKNGSPFNATGPALADARLKSQKPQSPLQLSGIRLDGAPWEILGVNQNATPDEIQKSYRELMKRYHPDIVGRPGTREWQDAQKIAEAINTAKNALLAQIKK